MYFESAKDLVRICFFEKKLKLYKEVAIISIISFKNRSYWYCEIMQFSEMFGIGATEWAM